MPTAPGSYRSGWRFGRGRAVDGLAGRVDAGLLKLLDQFVIAAACIPMRIVPTMNIQIERLAIFFV